jgi:heptosyltransferase-1
MNPTELQKAFQNAKRLLIIRLSSIGDVITGTPVPAAIKKSRPDLHVAWVVEDRSHQVLLQNPWIDEVIVAPRSEWAAKWRQRRYLEVLGEVAEFIRGIRKRGFDIALDFQGRLKSSLLAYLSGAPVRIGHADATEKSRFLYTHAFRVTKEVRRASERSLRLLEPLGIPYHPMDLYIPLDRNDVESAEAVLTSLGVKEPFAALCPATTFQTKFWTPPAFAQVADGLRRRLGLLPVIMGGPGDVPLAQQIASLASERVAVAAGLTSLRSAAGILSRASVVVSVDTGLLFAALAVGVPVVGIFGPTPHEHLRDERIIVISKQFPCSPCWRKPRCASGRDCMLAVTPEEVLSAAETLFPSYHAPSSVASPQTAA